jgi:hypothetical protein
LLQPGKVVERYKKRPPPSLGLISISEPTVYELARIMRTSVGMIEAHYGALIDTARESPLERLEAVK